MSSSGPGYLPYVSKIELICRLVRRWHSTPLLNTSITRRGEIHSGPGARAEWDRGRGGMKLLGAQLRGARSYAGPPWEGSSPLLGNPPPRWILFFDESGLSILRGWCATTRLSVLESSLGRRKRDYAAVTSSNLKRNLLTPKLEVARKMAQKWKRIEGDEWGIVSWLRERMSRGLFSPRPNLRKLETPPSICCHFAYLRPLPVSPVFVIFFSFIDRYAKIQ